jgi:ParB-like chromosome segregation protein Spo0J
MAGSLRRWGQLSPVVTCVRQKRLEVIDGFKRLAAARQMGAWTSLSVRVLDVDEPTAKAAILGLNRDQRPVRELEEAWVVQGLVRDDGMTQVEASIGPRPTSDYQHLLSAEESDEPPTQERRQP